MKTKVLKNRKSAIILICVIAFVAFGQQLFAQSSSQKKSNGVFEIISFSKDSVKFKTVTETKFYSLALISGKQIIEATMFSNSVGTVKWANGSQFWAGSQMDLPATFGVGAMTLPKDAVLTVYGFKTPSNFKIEKIRFNTDEKTEMYYNISTSSWIK